LRGSDSATANRGWNGASCEEPRWRRGSAGGGAFGTVVKTAEGGGFGASGRRGRGTPDGVAASGSNDGSSPSSDSSLPRPSSARAPGASAGCHHGKAATSSGTSDPGVSASSSGGWVGAVADPRSGTVRTATDSCAAPVADRFRGETSSTKPPSEASRSGWAPTMYLPLGSRKLRNARTAGPLLQRAGPLRIARTATSTIRKEHSIHNQRPHDTETRQGRRVK
jgi:hypothetical protein